MSRAMADTPKRRARRQFTDEFKASAVRLVLDEGKTVSAAARDLDLTATALREWGQARPRGPDTRAHGPDDRRARGVGAAPQSAADRGRRAGHP
jgi:transposase-like protein